MYLLALLTATAFLFTSATAKINGFSAPSTVVSGAPFDIQIHTENYIQAIEDVAIAFGIIGVEYAYPQTLGMLMGEKYLGPNNSNIVANITANVAVPTDQPEGPATITAALFSLIGARFSGNMEYFSVNVTIGKEMSTDYVTSEVEVVNSVATGSISECTE